MSVPAPGGFALVLCLAFAHPLLAQPVATSAAAPSQAAFPGQDYSAAEEAEGEDPRLIVVIGSRVIIAALKDVEPEQEYDEDHVASYDANTVGDVMSEIRSENGDDDPSILVNGRPVSGIGDIADLPVEAVRKIEQLPRGSAQRIGGNAGQRAYNIVLKPVMKSATVTVARQHATEGGWSSMREEGALTYIHQQDRVNLSLRHSETGLLLESERDVVPRPLNFPYSRLGNIRPFVGAEVDPALAVLASATVSSVALNGALRPSSADLLAGVNRLNGPDQSAFRSLRTASEPWDLTLTGSKELASWLSLSFNGRLNWSKNESLRGLPGGRFRISPTNAFTPFSVPVFLYLNDPSRPLRNLGDARNQSFAAALSASLGGWRASLAGAYNLRKSTYVSDVNDGFAGGYFAIDDATNPFDGRLAALIPVSARVFASRNVDRQVSADVDGPLFRMPAGTVRLRLGAGALWTRFEGADSGGASFDRNELTAKAGITVPLTGATFLPRLGSSDFSFDIARVRVSGAGTIRRYAAALNWSPSSWLRVTASQFQDGTAIYPELLAAPRVIYENVPYFDPLTGETVDVRQYSGGFVGLANEVELTRSLAATASALAKYNVQLSAEYQQLRIRNQLGAMPEASSAVVAAFPDRFVRDATGRLISVDTSSINFAEERTNQLRLGLGFTIPLKAARLVPKSATSRARRIPPVRLQFNLNHTLLLDSKLVIRSGLPAVDLLQGGAVGIAGNKQRNMTTATMSISRGATGVRFTANYRDNAFLQTGTTAAPDRLTFHSLFQLDVRLFADFGQLLPGSRLAKGTRLSIVVDNLFNRRQLVTDSVGNVPQAYQPAYRDPVGRSVAVELRKVF